ncbi:putative replication factor C small subunit [Tupanvirus deep ocean]|uniref:Replication factor C small subunit n=2 Tax=Tupanvirus TaxID=2094720 RepID=A0AC62A900_9VIRU|nr:putative replication factor C small subunit [Tupanvirus deep ocean]QKU34189.1 putative replication factor C small subunit [Tupanvirus deep ocean]
MFLFEKYRPTNIKDFLFNKEILEQLMHIASNEDIPHIIISGPPGGGKKTLVKFFLEALYDSDVNVLSKMKYNINGSSTKKEIEIMQSNYHIIIEPTNTNHDKYILQEIIKQYAMHKSFNIFKTKRKFKTIVIYNIENLANNSQSALRRTMELYAKTCRFVMVCNNLSKIFDPLRSRCRTFCVPLPSMNDISNVISHISLMEDIKLTEDEMDFILTNSNNSLKKAIWILDSMRLKSNSTITLDEVFTIVVDLILSVRGGKNVVKIFDDDIRTNIYNILITNIKGSEIITTLMDQLIKKIDDDEVNARIIQCASEAEYNLIHGRRDIIHIDYFVTGVMKELRKSIKKPIKSTKPVANKKSVGKSKSVDV